MKKEFICICCPKGCHITFDEGKISGNSCKRGEEYVKTEMVSPTRTLTSTMMLKDGTIVPLRSSKPLPKDRIFDAIKEINKLRLSRPIKMHQVLISNIFDLDVDIIATKEIQ